MAYNEREYQKTYINTAATTVIFSGRGTLGGICVNTTAAGTILISDGASPFASLAASVLAGKYLENIVISNSLTVSPAAASDITVLWTKG